MKVLMLPHLSQLGNEESGIRRVIEAYFAGLSEYGIELVPPTSETYDLKAVHAGMSGGDACVAHLHGLYWTADFKDATSWEYKANAKIVDALRYAKEVTVPSEWVAHNIARDMRFMPHVVHHGIDWDAWQHNYKSEKFVLWNKNRVGDAISIEPLYNLAEQFPETRFVSTYGQKDTPNITTLGGIIPHSKMKSLVQQSGVYLSLVKETFGIGVLEAMAAGVPVLGWDYGGNSILIEHGVTGYLAVPENYDDLAQGLDFCLKHGKVLGANGREVAKKWTWAAACEKVAGVYRLAYERDESPTVGVVIPVYNKPVEYVKQAIDSVLAQTRPVDQVIVVNDGSDDSEAYHELVLSYPEIPEVSLLNQTNQGVANARNNGIARLNTKYAICLDSDDWLDERFVEACLPPLERDRSLGIAYTRLMFHDGENKTVSKWPSTWDFDRQVNYHRRMNQIPTCCMFRREMWQRLGGYRQRYSPTGAGAEDAEFWARCGAYGWKAALVTEESLFNYRGGGIVGSNPDYREVDWLRWHPWSQDGKHPFASYASPARNKLSHSVRQYDVPTISAIIPVGEAHTKTVVDSLDSLEAQVFRTWEAVVVWDFDTTGNKEVEFVECAYPYITFVHNGVNYGAGYSRNRGIEKSKGKLITFLDADDTLHPDCLQLMHTFYHLQGGNVAIYTDYVGQATITPEYAAEMGERLLSFDPSTGEATINFNSANYDYDRAVDQPNPKKPYIWNLVTTLFPKVWHEELGGMDEEMVTWEDWDYWLRMAKAGKCFARLENHLVRYRFTTGTRRDIGSQNFKEMIDYLKRKYEGVKNMPCGCKGKKAPKQVAVAAAQVNEKGDVTLSDGDFVRAIYQGSMGASLVIGASSFTNAIPGIQMKQRGQGDFAINYGRIKNGDVRLVHKLDIQNMRGKWQIVPEVKEETPATPAPPPAPPVPQVVAEVVEEKKPKAKSKPRKTTTKRKSRKTTKRVTA